MEEGLKLFRTNVFVCQKKIPEGSFINRIGKFFSYNMWFSMKLMLQLRVVEPIVLTLSTAIT